MYIWKYRCRLPWTHCIIYSTLPQVEDQKARLLMLLGSKDVQLTLMTEMLAQNAYTVSPTRDSGIVKALCGRSGFPHPTPDTF